MRTHDNTDDVIVQEGSIMTNRELSGKLEQYANHRDLVPHVLEAARRLRELPDPTPEPVKDLRWLVERHECLSKHLSYMPGMEYGPWSWDYRGDNTSGSIITGYAARVVVRGIVKAMCDEHGEAWQWKPRCGRWMAWTGSHVGDSHDTELEAIDALLTAMEDSK